MNTITHAEKKPPELPSLNVFLAYATKEAGQMAYASCGRVASVLGKDVILSTKCWRFDIITNPDWTRQAWTEAIDSDLLLVAPCADDPPPPKLFRWLTEWAEFGQMKDAALGALSAGTATGDSSLAFVSALRSLATEHGMRFIGGTETSSINGTEAIDPELFQLHSAAPGHYSSASRGVPLSEWGINE